MKWNELSGIIRKIEMAAARALADFLNTAMQDYPIGRKKTLL
ncbi:hypothetical protein MGMO_100c00080 [Methyloglobulus morosus KoM1]|uniref:Uncharacterized protein n=1 Tax=Methyloglobulus morosus KoM1 TaxID=1116472 RepID=V5BZ02_9GAMM|nr:hypothetical protein MGMO_100c00080 [Methyloglobulus morosus KoM1]